MNITSALGLPSPGTGFFVPTCRSHFTQSRVSAAICASVSSAVWAITHPPDLAKVAPSRASKQSERQWLSVQLEPASATAFYPRAANPASGRGLPIGSRGECAYSVGGYRSARYQLGRGGD